MGKPVTGKKALSDVKKGSMKKPAAHSALKGLLPKPYNKEMSTAQKIKMLSTRMDGDKSGGQTELDDKVDQFKNGNIGEDGFSNEDMHKLWSRLKTARDKDPQCFFFI